MAWVFFFCIYRQLLKIALLVIYEFLLERFLVSFEHSGLCDPKRNRKIPRKNVNVAIKRVKSNASALALTSDSNIDEVNHAKVLFFIRSTSWNVEFLEVVLYLVNVS